MMLVFAVVLASSLLGMIGHIARQHHGDTEHSAAWRGLGLRQQRMINREMLLFGLACLSVGYLLGA